MRTTERMIELDLPITKLSLAARLKDIVASLNAFRIALRNRWTVNRIAELDDHVLADIGLTRPDVQDLLRSTGYADDPSAQLRRLARSRAEQSLRNPRMC
ncbi:DUF1127 domain-containing protein [Peteryoungia desertarenae]|uniref:DUF1127 domain-containing protein n=1 Tax=Peteryoungia desertarenae TaxID=1813451 RepID=A0ABX6QME4_9HYPH|nr:DUF1127 domain-containing protein [Peteryoungia desertarenae]QLF69481.1 DUF1127 domain-containing protein [Peteryoungia desertarenae]